ncbi:MAG: glutamate--tRNA ligase [Saprospiraceae bacterium]|nr:glutamate--tRNA ligase [Saprospiraceae bacterium]
MNKMRLRFAPSPTGALHIGGVRTALYNYLLCKKHDGDFILRIEDTDRFRFVPGAEEYILRSLSWCGIEPDEGPKTGGDYGPYRQSERSKIYRQYADELVKKGKAYYAFDTQEELDARREEERKKGNQLFKYDHRHRADMKNSLTLDREEVEDRLGSGEEYTIRLKVPAGQTVVFEDEVRGEVAFETDELDDKVLLKADGLPTYHLANVVDDHLMEITHVVRGEEWLPSTAHHVLLYRALGWHAEMPKFAHLPLILKPNGKGKLSKRDGKKLGIPVFPLNWEGEGETETFVGFREFGFLPEAVVNFLALLGWNPGTEQEIFSMDELVEAFSIDKIGKSGARFDFDKAKWFNQQYLIASDDARLAGLVRPIIENQGHQPEEDFLKTFCGLMKERVSLLMEFWESGYYFFEPVRNYDEKNISKRWKPERLPAFEELRVRLSEIEDYSAGRIKAETESLMQAYDLKYGDVLPILRLAMAGTMKGPAIFEMMELLGKEEVDRRLERAYELFANIAEKGQSS